MPIDSQFRQGDSLTDLLRKVLIRFNQSTLAPMSAATQFSQGDSTWSISRKILLRLNELKPTATGDVKLAQGDSLWSIWRKILQILNQMTLS